MRKRIFSGILSLLMVFSIVLSNFPVYATMTSHNTAGGAGSNSAVGKWAWTVTSFAI